MPCHYEASSKKKTFAICTRHLPAPEILLGLPHHDVRFKPPANSKVNNHSPWGFNLAFRAGQTARPSGLVGRTPQWWNRFLGMLPLFSISKGSAIATPIPKIFSNLSLPLHDWRPGERVLKDSSDIATAVCDWITLRRRLSSKLALSTLPERGSLGVKQQKQLTCRRLTTKDEKIQFLHRIALAINFTSHWQVHHVFPTPHMVLRVATLRRMNDFKVVQKSRRFLPFSKRTPSAKILWAKVYSKNVALQKWAPELLPSQAACRPQKSQQLPYGLQYLHLHNHFHKKKIVPR